MADNQNEDRFDRVSAVGKAALAIGAGAAFLYQGKGSELLSRGFRKAQTALSETLPDLTNKSFRELNGNAKRILSDAANDFKTSYSMADGRNTLRLDSSNSILNVLQIESQITNTDSILREVHSRANYNRQFVAGLQELLPDVNPRTVRNTADSLTSHINSYVIENQGNYTLSSTFMKDHGFRYNEQQINDIQDFVNKRMARRKTDSDVFVNSNQDLKTNISNELLNIEALEEKFGTNLNKKSAGESFLDNILGDTKATLQDLVDNEEQFRNTQLLNDRGEGADVMARIKGLIAKDERYGHLYVDNAIRINKKTGDINSFTEVANMARNAENSFMHTLLGKLAKPLETNIAKRESPNLYLSAAGEIDYILGATLEGAKPGDNVLKNTYFKLNNRGFSIGENNTLIRERKMDDMFLTDGRHGSHVRLYKNVTGDIDYSTRDRNPISRMLDINTTPRRGLMDTLRGKLGIHQNEDWAPNLVEKVLDQSQADQLSSDEYRSVLKDINKLFKSATSKLDRQSISKLSRYANDDFDTMEAFSMLELSDDELLTALSKTTKRDGKLTFLNEDLLSLVEGFQRNPAKARRSLAITEGYTSLGKNHKYTKVESEMDLVRKELSKEAFLRYETAHGQDAVIQLIDNIDLTGRQKADAKELASWAMFQKRTSVFSKSIAPPSAEELDVTRRNAEAFFSSSNGMDIKEQIRKTAKENASILSDDGNASVDHLLNVQKANRPGEHIYVKKGISVLDVINNINDTEKLKAFGKQFVAGRNNMQDFTSSSFTPYFGLFRLTDAVPQLAFSAESTGSVLDLAKNIATKRALPLMGAAFGLSYLDYESRNITGKGLGEAAINSFANFDLGIRSALDKVGLSESLKNMYYTNDLTNYLNDSEHRTASEQKEWYENGTSAVRKGRWWGMSTSEFRGGKIEYFEPNKLRQASVPWKDIGVYGSSEEKWSHSLIPTLRHPFSTIKYLSNPYWLEEKNKYSRPYPLSAPMFGEGAPLSGLLNLTVGNIIKPQKQMHREVLGNDFIDVRDLIANRNEEIKNRAKDDSQYIMLTDSNSATEEKSFSFTNTPHLNGSSVIGGDQVDLSKFNKDSGEETPFAPIVNSYPVNRKENKITLADKVVLATLDTGMVLPQLESINERIKNKAMTRGMSETNYAKRYDSLAAVDHIDMLHDKDVIADLRNTTSTKQYIKDIGYSAKQLSGIYGFMFDEILPGKQEYSLANASQMNSFSRSFWDASMGGAGGGFMEIARRFFPHANRDITSINPLRNTMPSWMPESFKHGDPYTKVKKGEMRLPGKAYEAMNHMSAGLDFSIHPYMTGASVEALTQYYMNKTNMDKHFNSLPKQAINATPYDLKATSKNIEKAKQNILKQIESGQLNSGEFYDDFTKFKILADVAPYSEEYKTYKSIVKDSLNNSNRQEYYDILDNVSRQSKAHDFYNYRYTRTKLTDTSGIVDQVTKDGFTIIGSDKIYSMAGVRTTLEGLQSQVQSGMEVLLRTDALNEEDGYAKAIVFSGNQNLNQNLIKSKLGERTNEDAIDAHALASNSGKAIGTLTELIGHAPIPFLHNRYFKLETALESYKNEQVYGTPYATWSHPIQGYLMPAINKAAASNPVHASLGLAAFAANMYLGEFADLSKIKHGSMLKKAAEVANFVVTPGASTGAVIGFGTKLGFKNVNAGMKIGSSVFAAAYLYQNSQNPFIAMGSGAAIGKVAGDFLETGLGKRGAKIGAAIGAGISYLKNPSWNFSEMFSTWKPKNTKKRWELEEYFDRLEYIKYKGLFEKASRQASLKEGVNIKQVISEMEKAEEENKEKIGELLKSKQKLSNSYIGRTKYGQDLLRKIDQQLVDPLESKIVKAGEYTKSAIAYKQAMDSTIYGLKENASWAQILRALPKNDRDYFLEFSKVKDKKEQDKILETVSPYKRKILENIWGRKTTKIKSNAQYFRENYLPNMFWNGWRPDRDLDHVQMKTIENEGMLLSDFGMYDSAKNEPGFAEAEALDYDHNMSMASMAANLTTSLSGLGLIGVDVSIEPSEVPGIQMVADLAKVTDFKIKSKINSVFGRTYY